MTRAYRFWTPEEEQTAKAMRAENVPLSEIAARLNRTPHAVEQALYRINGWFKKNGRSCSKCPTPISDTNKCGMCRSCNLKAQNREKDFTRRRLSSLLNHPTMRAGTPERRRAALKAAATRMSNPEYREWVTNFMRDVVGPMSRTPENIAKRDFKAAGRKISARYLSWCPEAYRDAYRAMRAKGVPVRDAKAAIFAQRKADEASLSPFERQERALARGAKLVANDRGPMFGEAVDHGEGKWEAGRVA
jgi:hypothetical protein